MNSAEYLALDFDGVISDSILECQVTAYNAYAKYLNAEETRLDIEKFSEAELAAFRESRVFIRRGEDYVYLLQAAAEKLKFRSQEQFDHYLLKNESVREHYRTLFYGQRQELQKKDPSHWLALNPLYPGIKSFLKHLPDPSSMYIVTTKDLESVKLILKSHDITLSQENMFQATQTYRKPQILQEIIKKKGLRADQLHFFDDHAHTLIEVKVNTDVNCYCAGWGYNSRNQRALVKERGIPVYSLDNLFQLIR